MSNLDRVTEAARAITNLGLPDNCVYSKCSPFEQSVIQEFIRVCFDARRELQEVCDYDTAYDHGYDAAVEARNIYR
jgi:hypothetical protein